MQTLPNILILAKMTEATLYIENNFTTFNALNFCKHFSFNSKKQAISAFESSIVRIGKRNLKTKGCNRLLIIWARSFNKIKIIELFTSIQTTQYFYDRNRKLLLLEAKNYQISTQRQKFDDLNRDIEQDENINVVTNVNSTLTDEESTALESTFTTDNNELHDTIDCNVYMSKLKEDFKKTYNKMKENKKWYLNTGKCVEDEVYCFGMQCSVEHQAHSFIVDTSDRNWAKYEVFTDNELNEIRLYNQKKTPEMPKELRDYLNRFNKTTTSSIRQEIFKKMDMDEDFDPEQHFDYDWIRNTCYNLLMEFEAGSLKVPHNEEWFKAHVWNFNDTIFNHSNIEVARGEVASVSSALRKNKGRMCDGIDIYRKKMGSKCDMLFRDATQLYEYGTSETGSKYDGDTGTKLLNEGYLKVPKTLKDMLDNLYALYPDISFDTLEVIGYVHAGLFCQVLRVDRPTQYTTRVTRLEPSIIRSEVFKFGSSVLPAIYKSYIVREVVLSVQNICNASEISPNTQDSSWLLSCVKRSHNDIPIPQTSTSNELRAKRTRKSALYD